MSHLYSALFYTQSYIQCRFTFTLTRLSQEAQMAQTSLYIIYASNDVATGRVGVTSPYAINTVSICFSCNACLDQVIFPLHHPEQS